MRKSNKFISLIVAIILGCSWLVPAALKQNTGSASEKIHPIVSDTFNDYTYNNEVNTKKWKKYPSGASIGQAGNGAAEVSFVGNGTKVQLSTKSKAENIQSVSFDFLMGAQMKSTWFSVNFADDVASMPSIYSNPVYLNAEQANALNASIDGADAPKKYSAYPDLAVSKINDVWMSMKIEVHTKDTATYFMKKKEAETWTELFTASWKSENAARSFNNAYVTIGTSDDDTGFLLDNLKIVSDNVNIQNDFTDGLGDHLLRLKSGSGRDTDLIIKDESKLSFAGASDGQRVTAANKINADESILKDLEVFSLSFDVEFPVTASETEEIAVVFALTAQSSEPKSAGSYAYIIGKNGGRLEKYNGNGENVSDAQKNKNAFSALNTAGKAHIQISINKNGSFIVKENEADVKTAENAAAEFEKIENYAGYFGFAAFGNISSAVAIDNAEAINRTYYVPVTKSLTNNFETDFLGNEGYEDFYMNALPDTSLRIENGKLVFAGASDGSFFGSAYQYDDFILDFKISNVFIGTSSQSVTEKTSANRWIGLDLGRTRKDVSSYGSYAMYYIPVTPQNGAASGAAFDPARASNGALAQYKSANSFFDETVKVKNIAPIPASYFTAICYDGSSKSKNDVKASDAVCVRFEAKNNNLKLYMKRAGDLEYQLYAEVDGVETSGYVALCCTGYLYAEIDDFSIANTSGVYECAKNEEPETITKEITKVIYDRGNAEGDKERLSEELNYLNTGVGKTLAIVLLSVATVTFGALFVCGRISAKKRRGNRPSGGNQ